MTALEVQTAHKVLAQYSENVGKSLSPERIGLGVVAGVYEIKERNMWIEAGMAYTRKQLVDACIFLTAFELLTDEGLDFPPSKYGDMHRYKITRNGIAIANRLSGLEGLMLDRGEVNFDKLMQVLNQKSTLSSIANTFINSPVNQFQQPQNTTDTSLSQTNTEENFYNEKTTVTLDVLKRKKSFKDILNQWWWAFIIPLIIGVILLAIEYGWFT